MWFIIKLIFATLLLTGIIERKSALLFTTPCKLNSDCIMPGRVCDIEPTSNPSYKCLLGYNQKCSRDIDCANSLNCTNNGICNCFVNKYYLIIIIFVC